MASEDLDYHVISFHTVLGMWLRIHAGINVKACQ